MTLNTFSLHILFASTAVVFAQAATAQAPADRPAEQRLGGPVIAGICLLSREAIFANAAVGKAASSRLQELTRAAQAEIDAARAPLEAEARTLEGQRASLPADQLRQQQEAFAKRWQAVQQQSALRSREIEATRTRAVERIADKAQPVVAEVYRQKGCGLLLDRGIALGGNFANDITADVVRGLDARIRTITFEREQLPNPPAGGAQAADRK